MAALFCRALIKFYLKPLGKNLKPIIHNLACLDCSIIWASNVAML